MPPKTADAADAFSSARREKLINLSLSFIVSFGDAIRHVPDHQYSVMRLFTASAEPGNIARRNSGPMRTGAIRNPRSATGSWNLLRVLHKCLNLLGTFIFHNIPYANPPFGHLDSLPPVPAGIILP